MELQQVVAVAVTVSLFVAIAVILRPRGARAVLGACLFVASLVSTQLAVKVLVSEPYAYRYPGYLTVLHFGCVWVISVAYFLWICEPRKFLPCSIGSCFRWVRTVLPIAISQPISVVFNNKAMVFVGAGVCAVIGTLSPIFTAMISRCFGRTLSVTSWMGMLVAFLGALTISWGEVQSIGSQRQGGAMVGTGLAYAFMSLFGRSIKIVVNDFLMTPEAYFDRKDQPEPLPLMHVYVLTFPMGALMSLIYAAITEDIVQAWKDLTPAVLGIMLLTCVCATALNFLGGVVLKELGASAQQIIGKLNTICIAGISVAFLGEHLPWVVVVGTILVLGGVAIFERGEHGRNGAAAAKLGSGDEDSEDSDTDSSSSESVSDLGS